MRREVDSMQYTVDSRGACLLRGGKKVCGKTVLLLFSVYCLLSTRLAAAEPPRDVPRSHWAARAVAEVAQNGVLTLDQKGAFHGDVKVTRTQMAIGLARLAKKLEAGTWQASKSAALPLPAQKTKRARARRDLSGVFLTRFEFASVLARAGDYAANGIRRAAPNSADAGKSVVLPAVSNSKLSQKSPAYDAVSYLASRRMLSADSPLLAPSDTPVTAAQLRIALSQMLIGLNDRLTDLGRDKDGGTIDRSSRR